MGAWLTSLDIGAWSLGFALLTGIGIRLAAEPASRPPLTPADGIRP